MYLTIMSFINEINSLFKQDSRIVRTKSEEKILEVEAKILFNKLLIAYKNSKRQHITSKLLSEHHSN